jgi:hypothetical protein
MKTLMKSNFVSQSYSLGFTLPFFNLFNLNKAELNLIFYCYLPDVPLAFLAFATINNIFTEEKLLTNNIKQFILVLRQWGIIGPCKYIIISFRPQNNDVLEGRSIFCYYFIESYSDCIPAVIAWMLKEKLINV